MALAAAYSVVPYLLFIVTPIVCGVFCVSSLFCCAVFCVISSFAIISLGKKELVALVNLTTFSSAN